jgi:GST-like protein
MIELFYWTTPNGHKIMVFLEEAGIPYRITPVNISNGDQHKAEFQSISPNGRIPAIIDHTPADGGPAMPLFESGAILIYLADKIGQFLPRDPRERMSVIQWLMWQMGGLGPMLGQNHHFVSYSPEPIPYAIDRYVNETARLYGVLDRKLASSRFVAGDTYSIADMACYPWIVLHKRQRQNLDQTLHLKRWFTEIRERPAVVRAYAKGAAVNTVPTVTEDSRKHLFGQHPAAMGRNAGERQENPA